MFECRICVHVFLATDENSGDIRGCKKKKKKKREKEKKKRGFVGIFISKAIKRRTQMSLCGNIGESTAVVLMICFNFFSPFTFGFSINNSSLFYTLFPLSLSLSFFSFIILCFASF
ncbi:hypothetical protein, unlikely [Trypanosoma brucei gambiense DAL972]|uniref:Uncharacterized protein n=1 Tax=Trypanosoma brucei gambiense (strain MHOM/CI/86/DAL972) TaxID=679716 RepID=C9ZI76_TRYB9|nr:hypothetical protein, unlikely [Trypanosoma brucei gambiense DAL972]CBH08868.1 hypothetical protein, unlikely [Trypanosoma brucei gambiense DAL972]|eukprot:XP_011771309.1 hypothetical protein, unlikely [Trypanosoma brucei gambiense DAL972]